MKLLKILLAAILVISLTISFAACGEKDLVVIRLNEVTHSIFYAPQYVALNLGFFEEEGLSIELINGQGADKVMTAVLSNQADIGFSGPEAAIYVYNEGKEDHAVVFAQLTRGTDRSWSEGIPSRISNGPTRRANLSLPAEKEACLR